MCGHSAEVHARSDINLAITDIHIKLIQRLINEVTSVVNENLAPFIKKKRSESTPRAPSSSKVIQSLV